MAEIGKGKIAVGFLSQYFSPILAFFTFSLGLSFEAMLGYLGPYLGPRIAVGMFSFLSVATVAFVLFVKYPSYHNLKWGGTVFAIMAAITFYQYTTPLLSSPVIDENKVILCLDRAHLWDNYRGSTNEEGNMARCITKPIEARYTKEEKPLYFAVQNNNETIPIDKVKLWIRFPTKKGITIKHKGKWIEQYPGGRYFYLFSDSINNQDGTVTKHPLFVTFTSPGEYQIKYIIKAREMKPVSRNFKIILE